MKPILVCTDFSPGSTNAIRYAANLAYVLETELVLVHTVYRDGTHENARGAQEY